jgi:2,3-bisphosphoglycerate-dependent phosphoglycerate mutase
MARMLIYLIRHGETASNAARILQTPEIPLSEHGMRQADLLARRLANSGITDIWSSDLRRAVMTAERLQAATGARVQLDPGLQERNYGAARGTPYAELGVDILAPDYAPPGGETWDVFHARVAATWSRLTAEMPRVGGNLAVVTHGLVCYSLALHHLTTNDPDAPVRWNNTSVTVIEAEPPWTVQLLNCTAHLTDL